MKTRIGDFKNYGTEETADGVMFTFCTEGENTCAITLYNLSDYSVRETVFVPEAYRIGDVYSVVLLGQNVKRLGYRICTGDKSYVDPYAGLIVGRNRWMDTTREEHEFQIYGGIAPSAYEWRYDAPDILPWDMVMYKLHMRGFTMNHGLPAGKRGNYRGLLERLSYLKDLGITTIEFQPIYDFEEMILETRQEVSPKGEMTRQVVFMDKTNYWGYGDAFYMAPKASYFGGRDAVLHCKEMIDAIHGAGMEMIMEMSFAEGVSEDYMLDCMWYWVKEYHVDGFHLLGCNVPIKRIAESKRLARTKIFHDRIPREILEGEKGRKHLFVYNDSFMYVCRQMQNHMQGSMVQFTNHLRRQNDKYGFVNYGANTNGFTLWDSYSYGEKHNHSNGEDNRDGNNINYSFNYGVEGETKNRQLYRQRMLQMRNGLCATMMSQAVPLLRSGDEVANSQKGNNNPYCQDNPIGWVQYVKTKGRGELLEFVRNLIAFRREHPILRSEKAMHLNDYKHLGAPDLSYHGPEPWLMGIGEEMKAVGILYLGAYQGKDSDNVYVAYNYHYEDATLAIPKLPKSGKWSLVMNTATEDTFSFTPIELSDQRMVTIPGGSISILVS
ncbi:MAG: alpha-amylase family glycosyl hydrolase [Lachnospiraceae bacterium]|nr:alpha-amylase family glycosyl hydrolase [Lachnospiraceae bacterium]